MTLRIRHSARPPRLTRARSKVGRADALSWMKAGTV
jgi:hypothetical protein